MRIHDNSRLHRSHESANHSKAFLLQTTTRSSRRATDVEASDGETRSENDVLSW